MLSREESNISGPSEFPSTVWSRLVSGEDSHASLDYLARHYWKPAYFYIRRRWRKGDDEARDLTQGFFAEAIESGLLSKAQPERGSFRRFLRTSIENFLRNDYRDSRTQKRGGGVAVLSLDALAVPDSLLSREGDPAQLFDREWLEAVYARSLDVIRERYSRESRPEYFEIFRRYEVDGPAVNGPTYEDLARELGLSVSDVRNRLSHARERWRRIVLEELRETVVSAGDLEDEVKDLFPR